jgi:hypothetical protein
MASLASLGALAGPAAADDPTTTTTPPTTTPVTTLVDPTSTSPETTAPPGAPDPGPLPPRAGPPPLPDQPPVPPGVVLPDPTPHIRLLVAQIGIMDLQRGQQLAALGLETSKAAQAAADAKVTEAKQGVDDAEQRLADAHEQLGSLAVLAYMGSGDGVLTSLLSGDSTAPARQRTMLKASIERRTQDLHQAEEARTRAEEARDQAVQAAADAARRVQDAEGVVSDTAARLADARAEEAAARAGRSRPSSSDATKGWQLTIEGANLATAEELAQWFAAQNLASRANAPVEDLTGWFVSEGADENIRGDMAFAQAIVETGYFANPDTVNGNNFAGIGNCDTCPSGFAFPDVQSGVRGQIQLLKSYAERTPVYKNPLVDRRLRGPAGCCQNWNQLTHVWASDPNYGPVILGVYEKLLTWVVMTRSANGGLPPTPRVPPG